MFSVKYLFYKYFKLLYLFMCLHVLGWNANIDKNPLDPYYLHMVACIFLYKYN